MAERMVAAALSAQAVHKAAGASPVFTRDSLMSWCLPLAEGMCDITDRLDEIGMSIRAMVAADWERRAMAEKSFGMSVRGAQEPHTTLPLDPDLFKLHARLGPHEAAPHVNGYGAPAPEGSQ